MQTVLQLIIQVSVQVIIILAISRVFSFIFKKLGQPTVVGEMFAGIILGKSFFALVYPEGYNLLFPSASLNNLHIISQIGLTVFMFIVGLETDLKLIKDKAKQAVLASHTGIIVPFALGVLCALIIYPTFKTENSTFISFSLFMGIVMSITAFPVLIRIIQEYKLTKTPLGTMAITCAAVDDITIWLVLAIFIGTSKSSNLLHCLMIGSFLLGIALSNKEFFKTKFIQKTGEWSSRVFLPLFFTFSGLRTEISAIDTPMLWLLCIIIIAFAVVGKLFGVSMMARVTGSNWKDSFSLGVLMNARGLMGLIVLNIGYDIGVLTKEIFTILVVMSLVTTMMAGPLLKWSLKRS